MPYIFHADDDVLDREDLKKIIESIDPSIIIVGFNNGLELMQYAGTMPQEDIPVMIFLDHRMPIWDGIRTLQALQFDARFSSTPIWMWSTAESAKETDLCLRLGASEFIIKPRKSDEWAEIKARLEQQLNQLLV